MEEFRALIIISTTMTVGFANEDLWRRSSIGADMLVADEASER